MAQNLPDISSPHKGKYTLDLCDRQIKAIYKQFLGTVTEHCTSALETVLITYPHKNQHVMNGHTDGQHEHIIPSTNTVCVEV